MRQNFNMDMNELAAAITQKIRDEIELIKIVDFGEVMATVQLENGGWTAEVLLGGAENTTNPLNCLQNYIPKVGDWVMIVYPPRSEPVLVDCTPMRENMIVTPDDKYASADDHNHDDRYYTKAQSDGKYAAITHDHDGRYYTKTQSDERYSLKGSSSDHNHDDDYYLKSQVDLMLTDYYLKTAIDTMLADYIQKDNEPAWTLATYENSWTADDPLTDPSATGDAAFYVDSLGHLELRGVISGGVYGSRAFTLPTGSRPPMKKILMAISEGGAAHVEILADGSVIPQGGTGWISLDGLSLRL